MSASPTKESSPSKADKPVFTEKEERVLKAAWHCLRAPPEVDLEKLKVAADFNTTKTASNTWGVIKKKLAAMAPAGAEGEGGDSPLATPKSRDKPTPKKRGKKATVEDAVDDEGKTPTKKRKTPKKKTKAAGDDELAGDEAVKTEDD
ncbi:hypothetical protein MBLNU13_g06645t1 [Cladosporium sp. NU13]